MTKNIVKNKLLINQSNTGVQNMFWTPGRVGLLALGSVLFYFTRRLALPNQIRYPTDCYFAFSYSPPHFAMTQLLSATTLWYTPTGTFTLLINCPRGRTNDKLNLSHTP